MQVLKFGGSSVADSSSIRKAIDITISSIEKDKTILVASAIRGATDKLIEIGKLAAAQRPEFEREILALENKHLDIISDLFPPECQKEISEEIKSLFKELSDICKGVFLIKEISEGTNDRIMSFGEIISTRILYAKFHTLGVSCKWVDARDLIKTEYAISQNIVNVKVTECNVRKLLQINGTRLYIIPGFIASDSEGRTTTLGRGGSDYTASILAAASNARILEIWTDVDGMMTSDPRVVPEAVTIEHISYKEALELSHFGAKVIYPPTIQPAISKEIPIHVKNTFSPDRYGTLIEKNPPESQHKIKGISSSSKIALLSMEGSGMVGIPGYSSRLFDALTRNEINIILITQASSVHTMLVAIDEKDAAKAKKAADDVFAYEISLQKIEPLRVEKGFSIISLVGDDMKNQSGAGGRMFEAIGAKGISIRAIAQGSSEKNVSTVVRTEDVDEAIRAIHQEFFGTANRCIHLYIAGYGNVGKSLINMIFDREKYLSSERGIELSVVAACNTKNLAFNIHGLSREDIAEKLTSGHSKAYGGEGKSDCSEAMIQKMYDFNLPYSIFVDCTSDRFISARYKEILSGKIGIVCCNKIANSGSLAYYGSLQKTAVDEKVPFKYETNVGAALPILSLIRQISFSGDKISSIEATLSGTLSYIFNSYDTSVPFVNIVMDACKKGYAEPDPRSDLQCVDVKRKAIILAREAGLNVEENDIYLEQFLPEIPKEISVERFFEALAANEKYFANIYGKAADAGKRLRYIVRISDNEIKVSLKSIGQEHPFFNLRGTDNALSVISEFYPSGITITGAGAGAPQTASGLLNDIITAY